MEIYSVFVFRIILSFRIKEWMTILQSRISHFRTALVIACVFYCFDALMAQDQTAIIEFSKPSYDFKEINEVNGPYSHVFAFVNKGSDNLKISEVSVSCGCTTPEWTSDEVGPGQSGFITASFNPQNRPGVFEKKLEVFSNAENGTQVLTIKGVVIPRPRTIQDEFPHEFGGLLSDKKSINYGLMLSNVRSKQELELFNSSKEKIKIMSIETPPHISVGYWKKMLLPEERMNIALYFDANLKNDLGYMHERITIVTDDSLLLNKSIDVTVNIQEYFPPLSKEDKITKPQIEVGEMIKNLGNLTEGDVVRASFVIKNIGKSNLNIRKIKTSCDCLLPKLSSYDISAGQETMLYVDFDTSRKRGSQFKTIYIFSNDRDAPMSVLVIRANVNLKKN